MVECPIIYNNDAEINALSYRPKEIQTEFLGNPRIITKGWCSEHERISVLFSQIILTLS